MSALGRAATTPTSAGPAAGLDTRVLVRRGEFILDAELRAPAGTVVALMGPSGAGKSTLLGVLAGLTAFDEGHVRVNGRTLDASPNRRLPPPARAVVLLGQDPRLFPHLTARDNVAFGLRAHGAPRAAATAGAEDWLRRVGLEDFGDRWPAQLSGGQQQRVALARALATSPTLMLLDEPLTSLDTETAADIRAVLREQLAATRTTAVIATHDAVDAVAVADRLVVLEGGVVTQSGPVREVLAHPATRFSAAVAGLNRVVGRVDAATWHSGGLTLPHPAVPRHPSVAAVFRPSDVHLTDAPTACVGEWTAAVVRLEQTPAGVRVRTADPDVAVDVAADAATGLTPGATVTLHLDASDVRFLDAP